jgi:hypothetical protein
MSVPLLDVIFFDVAFMEDPFVKFDVISLVVKLVEF